MKSNSSSLNLFLGPKAKLRIAFVHDNYMQTGGAERVAENIARIFPEADLFSTVVFPEKLTPYMRSRNITDTVFRHLPGLRRFYRHYFPLYPLAARSLNLSGYDVIITSCCGFAKMVKSDKQAVHICYCHTPTRWIWRFDDYAERENFSPLIKITLRNVIALFKFLDRLASRNPDFFIANSTVVAKRIKQFYGRDSFIVFPPIECGRFTVSSYHSDYYLIVSRLLAYKRIDLAIKACEHLGKRLMIIGDGPDRKRLESLARGNTQFLGRLSDAEVSHYMANCRAFIFPGEEDFGMTPLEANAAGKPCVAFAGGGALDTIRDGVTGILFEEPTCASLVNALQKSEEISWNPELLRQHAEQFDARVFSARFMQLVNDLAVRKFAPTLMPAGIADAQFPVVRE